ncbi:MAG: cell envelope integrity protein TolA, partial [Deltaproteobacteria bacterium]|nr:cell envelope integrity protein TolA [Deltaproteobacteria bacterium]
KAGEMVDTAKEKAVEAGKATVDAAKDAAATVEEKAEEVGSAAKKKAAAAGKVTADAVKDAAATLEKKAGDISKKMEGAATDSHD